MDILVTLTTKQGVALFNASQACSVSSLQRRPRSLLHWLVPACSPFLPQHCPSCLPSC